MFCPGLTLFLPLQAKAKKPLFVQFVLDNIWAVYSAVVVQRLAFTFCVYAYNPFILEMSIALCIDCSLVCTRVHVYGP